MDRATFLKEKRRRAEERMDMLWAPIYAATQSARELNHFAPLRRCDGELLSGCTGLLFRGTFRVLHPPDSPT
jgi:hypothetical protein